MGSGARLPSAAPGPIREPPGAAVRRVWCRCC